MAKKLIGEDEETTIYALRTLVQIAQLEEIVVDEETILSSTIPLVQNVKTSIRSLAVQVIGSICAGKKESLDRVVKAGVLEVFNVALDNEVDSSVMTKLCWSISNIASSSSYYIEKLLSTGLIHKVSRLVLSSGELKVGWK
jgi:hypothetical protein